MTSKLKFMVNGTDVVIYSPCFEETYQTSFLKKDGTVKDTEEFGTEVLSYFEVIIESKRRLIVPLEEDFGKMMASMKLSLTKFKNAISINPPFKFNRRITQGKIMRIPDFVVHALIEFDLYTFRSMGIRKQDFSDENIKRNVFKKPYWEEGCDLNWIDPNGINQSTVYGDDGTKVFSSERKIPSLLLLTMQSMSWYNRMLTGDKIGRYTVVSTEGLYPKKASQVGSKYNQETVNLPKDPQLARDMSNGLNLLFDQLETRKSFSRNVFLYNPNDVKNIQLKGMSSASCRQGEVRTGKDEAGVRYIVTPNGKKVDQEELMKQVLIDAIQSYIVTGNFECVLNACCIVIKEEIFNKWGLNPADRQKTYDKARDFFISAMVPYLKSVLVMKDRQNWERGKVIKVGMSWAYGGAFKMFCENRGFDPKMRYHDGDVTGLDTIINRVFLEIYSATAGLYYKPYAGDWEIFDTLLQSACEDLSVKMVHIFGSIWKIIIGCMPSGFFETSHGNSFIMAMWYYMYISNLRDKYPHRKKKINEGIEKGEIGGNFFGDDHIGRSSEDMVDIINEAAFSEYCQKIGKISFRDMRSNLKYLTEIDELGEAKKINGKTGIIFLKKRSVEIPDSWREYAKAHDIPLAPVVPFRETSTAIVKFIFGNKFKCSPADYMVAMTGMMYDNNGTNHLLHWLAMRIYFHAFSAGKFKNQHDVAKSFMSGGVPNENIVKLIRKSGISLDKLLEGIPSEHELMMTHIYDAEKANFTPEHESFARGLEKFEEREQIYIPLSSIPAECLNGTKVV